MEDSDHSGAITWPPVIFGVAFMLGVLVDQAWPATMLPADVRHGLGGVLLLLSGAVGVPTLLMFFRHRTSIHVHRPSTTLITEGPYRFSRNPAYVTLVLLYLGGAVLVGSAWLFLPLPAALVVLHFGVIAREERYLERTFGDDYRNYTARVRRWI